MTTQKKNKKKKNADDDDMTEERGERSLTCGSRGQRLATKPPTQLGAREEKTWHMYVCTNTAMTYLSCGAGQLL